MTMQHRDLLELVEEDDFDRGHSSRPKKSSLSFENVLSFLRDRGVNPAGDGLLLQEQSKGNKCPLRSPRPDRGVGTRLVSQGRSVGRGIWIGAGLAVFADSGGCEV